MPEHRHALFSVRPKWAELILSGQKTVELRRVTPKYLGPGSVIVLYQTGSTRRVCTGIVGEAEVVRVAGDEAPWPSMWYHKAGFESVSDVYRYWAGASSPCAIWLRGARRYARPIGLNGGVLLVPDTGIWRASSPRPPQSFRYLTDDQLAAIRREAGLEDHDAT